MLVSVDPELELDVRQGNSPASAAGLGLGRPSVLGIVVPSHGDC